MRLSLGSNSQVLSLCDAIFLSSMNPGVWSFSRRAYVYLNDHVLSLFSCRKRQRALSPRLFGWLTSIFYADYRKIKDINGLDCYLFVRFLRMMARIMLPIWLLSWAVLLPITAVHTDVTGHTGLDIFTFGNISNIRQTRYGVHLVLTWIFTSRDSSFHPCNDS